MTDSSEENQTLNENIQQSPSSEENEDEHSSNENEKYDGYCLLSADGNLDQINDDESPDEAFARFASTRVSSTEHHQSNIVPMNFVPDDNLWTRKVESQTFPMDDHKAEQIKAMMSSIQLPTTSIPSWAHICTEDQWQKILNERISCRQRTFFPDDEK